MQRKNSLVTLVVMMCVALSMMCGTAIARAADKANTLTVGVAEKEFLDDIQKSGPGLVVDVYQIATATYDPEFDTYVYTMIEPFTKLQASLDDAQTGAGDWTKLYDESVELAKKATPVAEGVTMKTDGASIMLDDGLYLVFVHGANEATGSSKATSAKYEYVFQSSIVALPTKYDKNGTMEGPIGTDPSFGEWQNKVTIYPKASRVTNEKPPTPPTKLVQTGDLTNPWIMASITCAGIALLATGYVATKRKVDDK